ncbi:MAG: hypothetical protein XD60_0503 [Acetothermia bacterium 64_32]|nr:MAG: hypothetical protein XD60_0503 [Acetothermia bacterium 64_32]
MGPGGGEVEAVPWPQGKRLLLYPQDEMTRKDVTELLPLMGGQGMAMARGELVDQGLKQPALERAGKIPV